MKAKAMKTMTTGSGSLNVEDSKPRMFTIKDIQRTLYAFSSEAAVKCQLDRDAHVTWKSLYRSLKVAGIMETT